MADASTNAPAKKGKTAAAGDAGQTISVAGPKEGRRRAGLHFGPTPSVVDLSTITPAQFEAIKADPKLRILAE
jgi:hypothetical protein